MATATIVKTNNGSAKKLKAVDYPIINISYGKPVVKIKYDLPFRVRFSTITVPGYSYPNNVPPIGIQVIGFSNWIL